MLASGESVWHLAEQHVPEIFDGLVQLGNGMLDTLARPVPVHEPQRSLKIQPRREQAAYYQLVDGPSYPVVSFRRVPGRFS